MMSTVTPATSNEPDAPRAGADLRAARERLGWSLDALAQELRIRRVHLEALEEGRLSMLPGHAYALAFVRTYARALGLDPEESVRRFRTETGEATARPELVFPAPVPERGLPAGAVVLLGLVLAVGAYVGWYRLSADGRLPAEAVVPVPERLAPLAEQAIPPTVPPASGPTAAPATARPGTSSGGPVMMAESGADGASKTLPAPNEPQTQPPAISPTSAAAASVQGPDRDASSANPAAGLSPTMAAAAQPVPSPDDSRIVIRASAPAWLLVKDKSGAVLLNRVLKPGETWAVPPRGDLLLTTGNAAGTDILLDGAMTASLGGSGVVRRDLPLDVDQIHDGKLAPVTNSQLASSRPRQ
ncbi:MAG TPA: RodZ domain-containing protein [Rhodopila sp.]|uniref:helix-turn-helix domain-containing protein n=1 Tax=Rhodopila sp. TaxID=2480087 RepID=UPI002C431721|nr:RodZ domain-containing protein [Rhodopila sp.]HVY15441.1 RodZ domain-containing protein [Rhodopila sp.]